MIHPTAIIHEKAQVDPSVEVGPYAVIDEGVAIGPVCIVGPHVHLTGLTNIGRDNHFHTGCVIGDAPQDLKYDGAPARVTIGSGNIFREHVTVHRSTTPDGATVIGSNNLLMVNSHVGHNSKLGDEVILTNGALLGGHVTVDDRAFISGNCLVHQFVRIGTLAMMQGGAGASKDVPPYTMTSRMLNTIIGLNLVGLRRAGLTRDEIRELKELYRILFLRGSGRQDALKEAAERATTTASRLMIDFINDSKRGVCSATAPPSGADP